MIEAARKLNYVPNSIASSLTTKRTNIVALILGNLGNPFYVQVLHDFSRRLQALGRQVLIFTVDPGADSDEAIMHALQYQIDGVILDGSAAVDTHDQPSATSAASRSSCSTATSRAATPQACAATTSPAEG